MRQQQKTRHWRWYDSGDAATINHGINHGIEHGYEDDVRQQQKTRHWRWYDSGNAATINHGIDHGYEILRPTRPPSVESDWLVPLLQGATTGLVAGSALSILAWAGADAALWPLWPAAVIGVSALAWMWRQASIQETLWTVERVLGQDLDGDGVVAEPPDSSKTSIIINGRKSEAEQQAEREVQFRAEYARFIRGCAVDTSLRRWEPALGRTRYNHWRDSLIEAGWAEWCDSDNRRQGWELVAEPEMVIESAL